MSQMETIPDQNLDPKDWESMRQLGHQMVDDLIDYWKGIREEKTWKPIPEEVKTFFDSPPSRARQRCSGGVRRI